MLLLCLFSVVLAAAGSYSDSFARQTLYPLSSAAFASNPQTCLTNILGDGKLQKKVEVLCDIDPADSCSGFTAISPQRRVIIISFRGSISSEQNVWEVIATLAEKRIDFPGGGSVNAYFYKAFLDVWNGGMKNDFLALKSRYPQAQITGHSLGAAMAALAAGYLAQNNLINASRTTLYTFGEPRSGDSVWAAQMDTLFPDSYRVTHNHDIVPHVPLISMNYEHRKYEVWYPNNMTTPAFVECQANEDQRCSDSQLDISGSDHMDYFAAQINDFARANCIYQ